MLRTKLLVGFMALLPLACKSSADAPSTQYDLLNLLGIPGIEHAVWQGTSTMNQCQNLGTATLGCANLGMFDQSTLKNNLLLTFSDTARLTGSLSVTTPHPDLLVPTLFTFTFSGITQPGPETGSGISQVLKLSPTGTNPVTAGGIQAQFDNLQSDVTRDALQGTLHLTLPGTNGTAITCSFGLTPIL